MNKQNLYNKNTELIADSNQNLSHFMAKELIDFKKPI